MRSRRSRSSMLVALGLLITAAGCAKSAPTPGTVVSLEQVCNGADGSRVRLSGYLRYQREMLSFCATNGGHETCDLQLNKSAEAPAAFDIMHPPAGPVPISAKLSVPVGTRTGEMVELPDKFSASDIKIHLPNGATAGDGTLVTVDGSLSVIPSDPKAPNAPKACFVNVDWVAPG